jgi:rubrerythrin
MIGPALEGLLRSLPPWNKPFEPGHKERFLKALDAILDLEYPPPRPPAAWDQGPCDECGTTWKANEVLPCPECAVPDTEVAK